MDLSYTPEELAFRDEVRAFLKDKLPERLSSKVKAGKRITKEDYQLWHGLLNERGWLALHWPVEYGGTGWTPVQKHIFEEEAVAAGTPRIIAFGLNMLGPVLIRFASEEQKQYYLPRILNDEDWWAQGYSEPGSGSDLASLQTRAVRQGDHYIVNGQKTWTTLGQYANKMFCLVRTSTEGKPQEGISFLLMDMATPGIEVRPIITLDGAHEVNEVYFTDVKVPAENLVGEENKGWTYAKYLLTYERTGIAGVAFAKTALDKLKRVAASQTQNGRPLNRDPLFAARMAQVEIDLKAMELFNLRIVAAAGANKAPGPESSLLKIKGTVIRQEITDLLRRAVGPYAMPFSPEQLEEGNNEEPIGPQGANPLAASYFNNRKLSIYGGSNEIQRNIVSKHMLGL
ncbi:MAG: acyl-CoA dehydrogenase family protein [Alphaproteobacteria bacterium]|nr:acyl-CoA dehydrogenase family protein [Alphaproteobacteria bacterium]